MKDKKGKMATEREKFELKNIFITSVTHKTN